MKDISDCISEYNHLYCIIHPLFEGNILLYLLKISNDLGCFLSFIQKKRLCCWLTEIEDLETAQKRADRNILKRLPLAYLYLDYERVRAHKQLNGHLEGTDESSFSTVPTQTQC